MRIPGIIASAALAALALVAGVHAQQPGMTFFITGVVTKKGKELGIPTPYNDAVVEIDRQINSSEIKMERSNFDLLKTKIATATK